MALTIKPLYYGQLLTASKTVLSTVPAGKAAIVKNVQVDEAILATPTVRPNFLETAKRNRQFSLDALQS